MHVHCFWKKLLHGIEQSVITAHLKCKGWSLPSLHLGMIKKLNAANAVCFYRYHAALISSHLWRGWMSIPGLYMSRMENRSKWLLIPVTGQKLSDCCCVTSGWSLRARGTALLCLIQRTARLILPGLEGSFQNLLYRLQDLNVTLQCQEECLDFQKCCFQKECSDRCRNCISTSIRHHSFEVLNKSS